ncbi:MAG: hypothetical protein ABSE63_01595 [Thermoguttaceae bacterium]|jgi:hypothetical protein
MKLFRICIFLLVAGSATIALGQYGLYGSPDPIQMSQQTPGMVPSSGYAPVSGGYPAAANYTAQRPMQAYSVQQSQPYASQPMQPYASQPMPAYAAQQMQSARPVATYGQMGPQYTTPSYPTPMYYTAAADQAAPTRPIAPQQVMTVQPALTVQQQAAFSQSPVMQQSLPTPAPGIQQNSGVMNQMLAEQGQCSPGCAGGCEGYAPYPGQCGNYRPYVNRYEQSACGNCEYGCSESSLWYASLSALVMTRDRPNQVYITYETGNLPHNNFPVDEFSWSWGGEVRFGRRFCCDCNNGCNSGCNSGCNGCCNSGYWALEASYWTLSDLDSSVCHTSPCFSNPDNPYGTVGTPLIVSDIQFDYVPGTAWFDTASEHRLWRRDEVQNVEVNIVRGQWCYGQDCPWDLGWSMGVRYFRFQESWKFGSLAGPDTTDPNNPIYHYWGEGGGCFEAYLRDGITNNLVGPQLGFELGYCMGCNLRFFLAPKVGIYDNQISNNFQAYLGDGTKACPTAASHVTGTYPVNSATNTVSFLTQVDVGVDWKFACHWNAQIGYRVVAVSSIGLADAQIPFYIVDIPAIADIDKNSDLILHGGFATIGYNF